MKTETLSEIVIIPKRLRKIEKETAASSLFLIRLHIFNSL